MRRVAFVLPRMGIGGVERAFLGLLQYAPRDKLDLSLILLERGGELLGDVPDWVHIRHHEKAGNTEAARRGISAFLRAHRLDFLFRPAKFLYHAIGPGLGERWDGNQFDVAVAFNDGLATWHTAKAIRAEKKIAFVHTDFSAAGYIAASERAVYRKFDRLYFGSAASKDHFLTLLPEFRLAAAVLPNCVDKERVAKLAEEPCEKLNKDVLTIVTVGRLSHEKGIDKVPKLLAMLKQNGLEVCWYVIGEGVERKKLEKDAKRLGVDGSLKLLGLRKNPYPYIAQCDLYVQPSNYEGYCIALAEARALCKPCIASDFAGAREQIQDGVTGYVTGLGVDELYEKLAWLVQNPNVRRAFEENLARRKDESNSRVFCQWWAAI